MSKAFETLPDKRRPNAEDWHCISANRKEELDQHIDALISLSDQLSSCIGCGCLSLTECPLRNPGDRMAEEGSGALLL